MPRFVISSANLPLIGRHEQFFWCSRCHATLCSKLGFLGIGCAKCHSRLIFIVYNLAIVQTMKPTTEARNIMMFATVPSFESFQSFTIRYWEITTARTENIHQYCRSIENKMAAKIKRRPADNHKIPFDFGLGRSICDTSAI